MANCEDFFCNHCKRETMFFLQSDLLWYCDECGNVLGSWPDDEVEDTFWESDEDEIIVKCPSCNNIVNIDSLEGDYLCPVCFESLGDELEKLGYIYDEEFDKYYRK